MPRGPKGEVPGPRPDKIQPPTFPEAAFKKILESEGKTVNVDLLELFGDVPAGSFMLAMDLTASQADGMPMDTRNLELMTWHLQEQGYFDITVRELYEKLQQEKGAGNSTQQG